MARKHNPALDKLRLQLLQKQGYFIDPLDPDQTKFQVAERHGVPLQKGYNGQLTTEQAGKVGGNIGGPMVRELVRLAKESMTANPQR